MTEENRIDFADAIAFIESSVEIFHDEPIERQENIKKLLEFLEALTLEDVDQVLNHFPNSSPLTASRKT